MSLWKPKGSPNWHYDFQRAGTRFRGSTGTPSRRHAERIEREMIARAEAQQAQHSAGDTMRLDTVAAWWWEHHGRHDRDDNTTWYRLENIVDGLGPATRVCDLDDRAVAQWAIRRRATPSRRGRLPAPATINREIEQLRRVLRQGRRALGFTLPDIDWHQLRRKEPEARVAEMTADEERAFFAHLPVRHHPIFRHYLLTGVRLSAATGLRRGALDLDAGIVTFTTKARPGSPAPAFHTLPVTAAMRQIYMLALADNPTDWVFAYPAVRTQAARGKQPALIRGQRYPYTPAGVDTIWDRAIARAARDMPSLARLRLHDLRHTAATRFRRQTRDLLATKRLLGHRDIRTTEKYAHADIEDLRALLAEHHEGASAPLRQRNRNRGRT